MEKKKKSPELYVKRDTLVKHLAGLARLIGWYKGKWFDYRYSHIKKDTVRPAPLKPPRAF